LACHFPDGPISPSLLWAKLSIPFHLNRGQNYWINIFLQREREGGSMNGGSSSTQPRFMC
jgi:hypothetical protein